MSDQSQAAVDRRRRQKIADMLLAELKSGEQAGWYYISVVHTKTREFRGGYLIYAAGPTDAWSRFHHLNLYEKDCETSTSGPADPIAMSKVPMDMRWRKLSKDEVANLGK